MNPYEVSQTSSDTIQLLLEATNKLESLPEYVEQLRNRLLQLQQVHSKSWHLLRHNNEHAAFIMARLESMDILCARLLPTMTSAQQMVTRDKSRRVSSSRYGYVPLFASSKAKTICCYSFSSDELLQVVQGLTDVLETWLEYQEGILEILSCQAFGVFPRIQTQTLEGYRPMNKVMTRIGEALVSGNEKCVIVYGPSGIGKSALAAYIASAVPEVFSDGAVEVHIGLKLTDSDKLVAKLKHLLQEMNCQKEAVQKAESLWDCWKLLEEVLRESSYLIVLDDVCDKEIVDRLMQIQNHGCKFLMTCRDSPVYDSQSVSSVKLGFKETASVSLDILKFHTGVLNAKMLPGAATKLLKYCSHHPLSVAILGEALRGTWRREDWKSAVRQFESSSGGRRNPNWLTGALASIDVSVSGMEPDTRQLFYMLAALDWSEPVSVDCLRTLWSAMGNTATRFLVNARDLVRRCLLKRRPDFLMYEMHEIVGIYLDRHVSQAVDSLLNVSDETSRATVAPWLLQYGSSEARHVAREKLGEILAVDDEELHAVLLTSAVDVQKSCPRVSKAIVGADVLSLVSMSSSTRAYAAITRYISACFTEQDYVQYGRGLVASGVVEKLSHLLRCNNTPGVNVLTKKDAADVIVMMATTGDKYVLDSLVRGNVVVELVPLLDTRSGLIQEVVLNVFVRLAANGEAFVNQMMDIDLLERLMTLLGNRKNAIKCRVVNTLELLVRFGQGQVVRKMLELSIVEELGSLLGSESEDVQTSVCMVCKQMFTSCASDGEGLSLDRLLKTRLVEGLAGLMSRDQMETVRCCAAAALHPLVQARGRTVTERIVRAAGVESIHRGLEFSPAQSAYSSTYTKLLNSIVNQTS